MGAKNINRQVNKMIKAVAPTEVRFIDPTKMAMWPLEFAIEMVGGAVSKKTLHRAIDAKDLNGFKAGKEVCVIPSEFLVWFKRFKQR